MIALRYVLGYDVKRAAAMMGVSHQTISSLTYYAKRALADALGSAVRGTERGGREQDESGLDQDTYKEVRA